jgi:hypothetical protein
MVGFSFEGGDAAYGMGMALLPGPGGATGLGEAREQQGARWQSSSDSVIADGVLWIDDEDDYEVVVDQHGCRRVDL